MTCALSCLLWPAWLAADIKIGSNAIYFDINDDGTREMKLTPVGLGIGVDPSTNLHVGGNTSITGNLYMGSTSGNNTLNVAGTMAFTPEVITSDSTASHNTLILANTANNNITLTLPNAASNKGRTYDIKKMSSSNNLRISGNIETYPLGILYNANTTLPLPALSLISDGSKYYITHMMGGGNIMEQTALVESVQTGTFTLGSGNTQHYINLASDVGDLTKTLLIHSFASENTTSRWAIAARMLNTKSIYFRRSASLNAETITYYVIKFSQGVFVQRGVASAVATSQAITISEVDYDRSFPIVSMYDSSVLCDGDDFVRAVLTNSTTLTLTQDNGTIDEVDWQVVQFNSANVQSGAFTMTGTSATATLSRSINTSKSWLNFSGYFTNVAVNNDDFGIQGRITNSTTLTFTRPGTSSGTTFNGQYYLIEFFNNSSVQSGLETVASTAIGANVVLGTAVDLNKSFAIAAGQHNTMGTGALNSNDEPGWMNFSMALTNTTNLQLKRKYGNTYSSNVSWFVIELE